MVRKILLLILILPAFILRGPAGSQAQESPNFQVVVNMVQLNVAVTDRKGNYITGLRPKDFAILEDGIAEKAATFAEGDEPARKVSEIADQDSPAAPAGDLAIRSSDGASAESFESLVSGANVF